jgi:ABC-type transport system involved in cytochrome c biogenesis permease subunit
VEVCGNEKIIVSFNISHEMLDEITYKVSLSASDFYPGGLIFGAIWADQAWGNTGYGTRKKPGL